MFFTITRNRTRYFCFNLLRKDLFQKLVCVYNSAIAVLSLSKVPPPYSPPVSLVEYADHIPFRPPPVFPPNAHTPLSCPQHSPQLQFTPPQSPYTASPRGGRNAAAGPEATASNTNNASSSNSNGGVNANNNNNDPSPNPRWSTAPGTSGPSGGRAGAVVGSPISVAGAVAASTLAAAAAAASAASAAVAAGVGDGGRASGATGAGGGGERVEQLKREKRKLHVMLKNFEKDFKERNGREVSCLCTLLISSLGEVNLVWYYRGRKVHSFLTRV